MLASRNNFALVMGVVAATPMCYYIFITLKNGFSTLKRLINTLKSASTTQFVTLDNDKVGLLSYSLMGQKYNLLVPYDTTKVAPMIGFKAFLGNGMNITQQPGIPYSLPPSYLGYEVKLVNEYTGDAKVYSENMLPMYAEELFE